MTRCRPVLLSMLLALSAAAQTGTPLAELFASDASIKGDVVMTAASTEVMSGSTVSTGKSSATLRLSRGGDVRVCPRTVLSLSTSPSGKELMLAMGAGAIEMNYRLGPTPDTVLTPDFRLLLAGPGEFHFAVSADSHGNTCVKALPSNTSSIIVYEQMGNGIYQVRPHDQVLFRGGSVANPEVFAPPDCGCPPPAPVMRAETIPPAPPPTSLGPSSLSAPLPFPPITPAAPPSPEGPLTLPAPKANDVHVEVDAPFVFRGDEPAVPPAPIVARVRLQSLPSPLMVAEALPPAAPQKSKRSPEQTAKHPRKGFFGHLRSFFAAVFH